MAVKLERKGFWEAFDERLGLSSLDYEVPAYANTLLYSLGGLTLLGFVILAVTGIWMTQFYNPSPAEANASIHLFTKQLGYGAFLRNLHFWTAQAVVVTIGLHLARVVFTASYKRPREGNWYVGIGLFLVTLGLVFTGTVLKWDQEGYEAFEHAQAGVGLVSSGIAQFLTNPRGTSLLARFFSLHISILPLTLLVLIGLHLLLVKAHGISPLGTSRLREHWTRPSTFRRHLTHLLGLGTVVYGVVAVISFFVAAPLGDIPIKGVEISKPPWFFWPLYAIENRIGIAGLVWVPLALIIGLLLLPLVDRGESRWIHNRWWVIVLLIGAILFAIGSVVYVGITPPVSHINM